MCVWAENSNFAHIQIMQPIQGIYPFLKEPKKIVVTTHQKPDGDAMGASLGLYHFLLALGHKATVISPTNWADFLNWMPGADDVMDFESGKERANHVLHEADILFCLDFNVLHRTKDMEKPLTDLQCIKVLIDHHQQPQESAFTFGESNVYKSSTCEMIYDFIVASPFSTALDKNMATCIYTGLLTDTGSFRFPSATAHVHRVVAHLMDLGINHSEIFENLFDNFSENRLRFIGNALLNRLEVMYEMNTALMAIPGSDVIKYNIKTGDTEGLVNYMLTIQGIRFGALLIDRKEERKWSFRSKGNFDVNKFAREHFNGGGHMNASGGKSINSLQENISVFKKVLREYQDQLQ